MVSGILVTIAVAVVTFLLGSIPWGVVISKVIFHDDVRSHGSGNIGTTNMIRAYGKKVGYACFVLDFGKALLAGWLAGVIISGSVNAGWITADYAASGTLMALTGICCIYGHIFSPWLGFNGGKGIAAGVGCVIMVYGLQFGILEVAVFAVLVVVTKYVSVGSIAAAVLYPFIGLYVFWGNPVAIILCFIVGATVVWAHRANISRLLAGTENRVGSKKKTA